MVSPFTSRNILGLADMSTSDKKSLQIMKVVLLDPDKMQSHTPLNTCCIVSLFKPIELYVQWVNCNAF